MIKKTKILDVATVIREWPKNLKEQDRQLFAHEIQKEIPTVSILEKNEVTIDRSYIYENLMYPVSKNLMHPKKFTFKNFIWLFKHFIWLLKLAFKDLLFSVWCRERKPSVLQHLKQAFKDLLFSVRPNFKVNSAMICVDEFSSGSYFHWLCDVLPRLELLTETEFKNELFLFPPMETLIAFRESLAPYEIQRMHFMKLDEKFKAQKVFSVTPVAPSGNHRPKIMQAIRKRFLTYFAADIKPKRRKIWVSRQRAPKRTIVNEADLVPILHKHGWESMFMEDLTFADQVRLMAESTAIGGLHGAGLTNMLFMPAGGQVLEVRFRGDAHNNCYFSLASALEHEYWYLLADFASGTDVHVGNVKLDADALDRVLGEMEGGLTG